MIRALLDLVTAAGAVLLVYGGLALVLLIADAVYNLLRTGKH